MALTPKTPHEEPRTPASRAGCPSIAGFVIYVSVATVIEKSGLKRLGATGNLFTCDPKEDDK